MRQGVFSLILFLLGSHLAYGKGASERFVEGTQALENGKTASAIAIFEEMIDDHWHSAALYHNLGVAYQRQDSSPRALVAFYRSWLLAPFSSSAKQPFQQLAQDTGLSSRRLETATRQATALAWQGPITLLAMLTFWSGMILAILAFNRPWLRNTGLSLLGMGLLLGIAAYLCHHQAPPASAAWVVSADKAPLRATHDEAGPVLSQLSPFTVVHLSSTRKGWHHVQLENGLSGWVQVDHVERLRPWLAED